MKKSIITVWENDKVDDIEIAVEDLFNKIYRGYTLKQLSAFDIRTKEEVWESIEESYAIIFQTNLIDPSQLRKVLHDIAHPIWGNFNGNTNNISLRYIHVISSTPFQDAKRIIEYSEQITDTQGEEALPKIVKNIRVLFHGLGEDEYEMVCDGYNTSDIKLIRIN